MPDWTKSMQQSFEYYVVDPGTWKDKERLRTVKSCTIQRDSESDTLGSATIDVIDALGECYVRVYLVTVQNGVTERFPLGTYLVQTPASSFDGKTRSVSLDAYTPLLELKDNLPPIGYFVPEGSNIMEQACALVNEHTRAPVVATTRDKALQYDFIADPSETWFTFINDLLANINYTFDIDELGRTLFAPKQDISVMQPVWTYDDGNSSILGPEVSMSHDLFGIPNVVEVIHSKGDAQIRVEVVNEDPSSPTSIQRRGRRITKRVTDPDTMGVNPDESEIREYAQQLLKELSTVEYQVTYTHAYCPVRPLDCVRLNYAKAGLNGVKAKVISQSIKCDLGCQVQETAVFTRTLWEG